MVPKDKISLLEGYRNRQVREANGTKPYNLLKQGEINALDTALDIIRTKEPIDVITRRVKACRDDLGSKGSYRHAGGTTALNYVMTILEQ